MALEAIDVAVYQGSPDWNAVAGAGIALAIAKASEGDGFEDPTWRRNQAALLAPGPIVGGSYHFARPDLGNSPQAEASWYLSRHDPRCFGPGTPWVFALDAESAGGDDAWVRAFLDAVSARIGYSCWLYSYSNWLDSRGITATNRPLWEAWPNPGDPPTHGWSVVTMQQYGERSVPGIAGAVDADRFFGDAAALKVLAGVGAAPKPWDGNWPMPALGPQDSGVTVVVRYPGVIMPGAHWYADRPDGADMGPAPTGQTVWVRSAQWDGGGWWDSVDPPDSRWLLKDPEVDSSDAAHPPPVGIDPRIAWNEAHQPAPPTPAPAPPPPPPPAPAPPPPAPAPAPPPPPPPAPAPPPPAPAPPSPPTPPPAPAPSPSVLGWLESLINWLKQTFGWT